ncbi:MAG: hypothetical protein CMH49_08470 [Myxococcales bacterium]|nr:hypothetical protein [Myxococcales bacterium]
MLNDLFLLRLSQVWPLLISVNAILACEDSSPPPFIDMAGTETAYYDGSRDCRSPLYYCDPPLVCALDQSVYRCVDPQMSPGSSSAGTQECPSPSSGLVYPVSPRVHVDAPNIDPLDSANIEPSVLNVTAYAEYMTQLLRGRAEPLRDPEGIAYYLAQRATMSSIPFEVGLSLAQRNIDSELLGRYWSEIVPEVRGTMISDDPPRVMQRIVQGETMLNICEAANYSRAACCETLAWFAAMTRDEDLVQIESGELPMGYSSATVALLDRERSEVELGEAIVVQPFVQLGVKAWLSYCGDEMDQGPPNLTTFKQLFGDYHLDRCNWSQELHPLSAAKKTGRRIYRKNLGQGQKVSIAETINARCEVIETEIILLEGVEPLKFWSFDRKGHRVWHAVFLRKPGEDSLRYTPDSCMGCHYTFDQRRFKVVEPSYEALNLKFMILRGEEQWEDAWGCVTPDDYVVTHAAEVIQRPPPADMLNETPPVMSTSCTPESCSNGRRCDALSGLCIECSSDEECVAGEVCTDGGMCAQSLTIGGPYEPYLVEVLTRALECWDSHYGSDRVETCYELEVLAPLLDMSGSERTSTGRALDVESEVCDPNGEVARQFSSYEYGELRTLFGCGPQNAWNLWWEEGFTPAEQLCISYSPVRDGFSNPPYQRTEVVTLDSCDRR